ncbi:Acg family FMN-binding oxidoreductase [Actinophytocola xanthii]|uniref:NAD(P)H nitroreductase n=1 Tax=Actinophytocola xanthii TaxID=1912961 RepID=A0A1Q8C6J3_9PSEU|nr:nitroreductase family protein [Actinophytocola xanthii]OLF09974.1 NAD(P)H nitroreductase [Actinophytocola xanthii]
MTTSGPDRDTLRHAVALATRAPSVHNTQPWRWLVGESSVHLFADLDRRLPATDPDGRDLLLSCGAALHHLRIALATAGWGTVVHRLPNPADPTHLASVEMHPHEPTEQEITLARAIQRRQTDRRRFSSWPVPPQHLGTLAAEAARQGALAVAITDPTARFRVAGAIAQAAVVQEADPAYSVELAIWTGRGGAATDGVLAGSTPARRHGSATIPQRSFAHGTLGASPKRYDEQSALLMIATSSDDTLSRLRAGEATSTALLAATRLRLAACPLSQPLQISHTRRVLRDEILEGTAEPQLLLRLGWAATSAEPLPFSPRRNLDEVLGDLPA